MCCGICGEYINKRIYCGTCAGHLTLRPRINFIKAQSEAAQVQEQIAQALGNQEPGKQAGVASEYGDPRLGLLDLRIATLKAQLKRTQQATLSVQTDTEKIRHQVISVRNSNSTKEAASTQRKRAVENDWTAQSAATLAAVSELEKSYRATLSQTLVQQRRCCQDVLAIYGLKKKRRRTEYDIVLGFDTVPALGHLASYSVATINSGIERVTYFIVLLASYLGIQLPFELSLPRKSQPYALAGTDGIRLQLPHSVKTMLRSAPADFYEYCRGLAILSLDVAYLAAKLGVPNIDTAGIPRINHLVAQISLRLESVLKSGHQIQIHGMALAADVETVQDNIINTITVDVNGKAAEWVQVDALPS